jgi:hypothetical protein
MIPLTSYTYGWKEHNGDNVMLQGLNMMLQGFGRVYKMIFTARGYAEGHASIKGGLSLVMRIFSVGTSPGRD